MQTPSCALFVCCLALAFSLPAAAAERASYDDTDRWVPSLSVSFDLFSHSGSGSVTSGNVEGPPLMLDPNDPDDRPDNMGELGCVDSNSSQNPKNRFGTLCKLGPTNTGAANAPLELMPDSSDKDDNVLPMVVGSFELMTPRLFEGLAQPRLFAHADLAGAFGFQRRLAGVLAPGGFSPPMQITTITNIQEDSIPGQGSRTNLQTGDLVFSAGVGVAFAGRALGRSLRIKPSFEYIRQPVEIRGILNRAVKLESEAPPETGLDRFRLISLTTQDDLVLHGFGGGLELEADTSRLGPLVLSVFLQGRVYYFPNTLDERRTTTNEWGETASWTFELDPWAWRSAVGLRFRWLPERSE